MNNVRLLATWKMSSTPGSVSPSTSWILSKSKVSTNTTGRRSFLSVQNVSIPTKTRVIKKFTPGIDTNLNSYDRTDPFFAFNTLIKLLGTLPSRIGGCKFKLTPDEHRLSLRLLAIIEPFVGLEPSRRSITRQPTEVLDSIIFHVDSKRDLLSLSLSCRRMYDVIFPRHFQYRVIKCKVSSISIWNHLIVNRALAMNVRRLDIIDERSVEPFVVPSGILTSDTDLESTDDELGLHDKHGRYLVSALTKMTSLVSFSWSCNHSPISMDNVWPALLRCHSLCQVEINDNLVFATVPRNDSGSNKPRVLPKMTTITFRSTPHVYGSTKHPSLERISGILNNCPNVKTLDIGYIPPRNLTAARPLADDLLLYGRWPQLTSLTLTNVRCASDTGSNSASTFLFAHLNLEVLHLDINTGAAGSSRLTMPPNSLPRLRELHANKEVMNAILECPCNLPRPLETLKGFRLSGTQGSSNVPDAVFLLNLKRYERSIKRVELKGWNELEDIRRLIESTPALTWLDVGKKCSSRDRSITVATNVVEWATVLSELPDLTAFHGVKFFYEVSVQATTTSTLSMTDRSRVRKNDEVAGLLAWKCGKLRRVDHWEECGGKVVVLVSGGERVNDGDKVRWEVRRVKV